MNVHHVGFVVPDIVASVQGFTHSLSMVWDGNIYEDPIQRVKVTFLATGSESPLMELVQPAADDSPVGSFLRERGGGLHHICYEVSDLEAQITELKSRGAMIVRRPKPAVAFQGRRIAWLLTTEKLLIELLEDVSGGG